MNSDEYNKKEEIVDVPYYTRDLCKDNKFRFARRLIRFENISKYRRIISEKNYGKEYFQTKKLIIILISQLKNTKKTSIQTRKDKK